MVQMGRASPQLQAAFQAGPGKSPVSFYLLESCSPPLHGGTQLHKFLTPGEDTAGSNPSSKARVRAEATCVVCHICKESMAWVSTAETEEHQDVQAHLLCPRFPLSLLSTSCTKPKG